jgi:hypothetical protein
MATIVPSLAIRVECDTDVAALTKPAEVAHTHLSAGRNNDGRCAYIPRDQEN